MQGLVENTKAFKIGREEELHFPVNPDCLSLW